MIERTYNVPLRTGFRETAKHKKTKKAVTVLKEFIARHMHSDTVLIGKNLNQELWKHGIKNPPHHVKVSVIKEDDGTVKVELHGFKYDHKKKDQKEKEDSKEEKSDVSDKKSKDTDKKIAKEADAKDAVDTSSEEKKEKPKVVKKTVKLKKE